MIEIRVKIDFRTAYYQPAWIGSENVEPPVFPAAEGSQAVLSFANQDNFFFRTHMALLRCIFRAEPMLVRPFWHGLLEIPAWSFITPFLTCLAIAFLQL